MPMTGFNHNVQWNEFRTVNNRPSGASEDAFIRINWRYNMSTQQPGGQNCRVVSASVPIGVDRSASWVLRGSQSATLLQHEQGHYNITALGARDFYNQLLNLTAARCPDINTQARTLKQQIQTQIDQANRRYDTQTNHGTNTSAQRTWDSRIRSAMQNQNGTLADLPQ